MSSLSRLFGVVCLWIISGSLLADDHRTGYFGIGEVATPEQISGWDIDIRPDGEGLPEGEGSVADGEWLYEAQCAECHGSFGEGVGRYPVLAGGQGTLSDGRPTRTVGSYWAHLSTLWDYIHRAMPFTAPESLSDDEVYAITAYVLYLNDIVDDEFVLSKASFLSVEMPNAAGFYRDDRPDVSNIRCMEDCLVGELVVHSSVMGFSSEQVASLEPESETSAEDERMAKAKSTYESLCGICHASGIGGAPIVGDAEVWKPRLEKGLDALIDNAIVGYIGDAGVMPAKGGFAHLSDEDVSSAVEYMVDRSR